MVAMVGCSHLSSPLPADAMVGLWQFPERRVWVRIHADGTTFQCRIASSTTVFRAKGRFVAPDAIRWQDIWGTDRIAGHADRIVLHGQWGDFAYVPATSPLDAACLRSDAP